MNDLDFDVHTVEDMRRIEVLRGSKGSRDSRRGRIEGVEWMQGV